MAKRLSDENKTSVKRFKSDTYDEDSDTGYNEMLRATTIECKITSSNEFLTGLCETTPLIRSLIDNAPELATLSCGQLLAYRSSNPQIQRLVNHISALIHLNDVETGVASDLKANVASLSNYDKQMIEWAGLETFDVLCPLKHFRRQYSLSNNLFDLLQPDDLYRLTEALGPRGLLKKYDLLVQRLRIPNPFPRFNYKQIAVKRWFSDPASNVPRSAIPALVQTSTCFGYGVNDVRIADDLENEDVLRTIENEMFRLVIETQQRTTPHASSPTAHTAVVAITNHGVVNCAERSALNAPMYTIPAGKTLTILSVATPNNVNCLPDEIFDEIMDTLRRDVSELNVLNTFIHPLDFANKYITRISNVKSMLYEELNAASDGTAFEREDYMDVKNFVRNYRDPRIVSFNEGDDCINKSYSAKENDNRWSVFKFNFNYWDHILQPPVREGATDVEYQLSEICDYLFNVEEYKNIVLLDWSCSVVKMPVAPTFLNTANIRKSKVRNVPRPQSQRDKTFQKESIEQGLGRNLLSRYLNGGE